MTSPGSSFPSIRCSDKTFSTMFWATLDPSSSILSGGGRRPSAGAGSPAQAGRDHDDQPRHRGQPPGQERAGSADGGRHEPERGGAKTEGEVEERAGGPPPRPPLVR